MTSSKCRVLKTYIKLLFWPITNIINYLLSMISFFFQKYPFLSTYPAVGALEDTKDYVENFIDPNYILHITMTKVLADVILRLSDSAILPFDLQSFIDFVENGKNVLSEMITVLASMGKTLGKTVLSI